MSRRRGRGCCPVAALGARAALQRDPEIFEGVLSLFFFFQLGKKAWAAAAAACTCAVKKEGLYDASWLQRRGILGKADKINRLLVS